MAIVQELLREYHPRDFAVELWDGSRLDPDPGQFCRVTWHINHTSTLRAVLRSGADDAELDRAIRAVWERRSDRYSELRTAETAAREKVEMSYIGG